MGTGFLNFIKTIFKPPKRLQVSELSPSLTLQKSSKSQLFIKRDRLENQDDSIRDGNYETKDLLAEIMEDYQKNDKQPEENSK